MRKVPLKVTALSRIPTLARAAAETMGDGAAGFLTKFQKPFSYAEQFTAVIEGVSAQGKTIAELRQALAIIAKIEAAVAAGREAVLLEDSEYATLKAAVDGTRWTLVDPVVLAMADDLANAPAVDPNTWR